MSRLFSQTTNIIDILHYIITITPLLLTFCLHLEIRDIWRPGASLAGTRDSMAQIRDIPGNPGRVATLPITCHITSHGENGSRPQKPLYPRNNEGITYY